jgi:hypothetical protein
MAKLKATRSILYLNRLYEAGDELPYYDAATVKAWVEAKSAFWEDEESDLIKTAPPADTTPGTAAAETESAEVKQASQPASAAKKKASRK